MTVTMDDSSGKEKTITREPLSQGLTTQAVPVTPKGSVEEDQVKERAVKLFEDLRINIKV